MFRKMTLAAAVVGSLISMPALAAGTAADGVADMSKYNLIVLGDWQAGHDVEGRAIVTGNATGNSVTVGIGRTAAGQSATPSTDPTLVIGGFNSIGSLNVNNGSNGGNGTVSGASSVWIKGNSNSGGSINLNGGGATSLIVGGTYNSTVNTVSNAQIGGSMTNGTLTPANSSSSIKLGGTKTGGNMNLNGASYQEGLGAGFKSGLEGAVNGMTSNLADNANALKAALSGLSLVSNPSSKSSANGGQTLVLNAVQSGNGFSLFNLTQADLAGYSSIAYNFNPDNGPVVINFTGATVINPDSSVDVVATLGLNFVWKDGNGNAIADDFTKVNQSVIWNFQNATKVNFTTEFFGSVLATNALVTNNNAINGSVVAGRFNQGGEVHLGTFDGITLNAVPEPGTWALMILGFGLIGAAKRRETRLRHAA